MDSSGCQIVYLDGDPKTASLEPPSPETTEKKSIVSSSWQCFSYWKTALLSSLSLLPFKPNIPDCCNCFLSNQVPIPLAIWISFSTLVFLELCWLWPTERSILHIISTHIPAYKWNRSFIKQYVGLLADTNLYIFQFNSMLFSILCSILFCKGRLLSTQWISYSLISGNP